MEYKVNHSSAVIQAWKEKLLLADINHWDSKKFNLYKLLSYSIKIKKYCSALSIYIRFMPYLLLFRPDNPVPETGIQQPANKGKKRSKIGIKST